MAGDDRGDECSDAQARRGLRKRSEERPCLKVKESLDAPGVGDPGMVETDLLRPLPLLTQRGKGRKGECENPKPPSHHE